MIEFWAYLECEIQKAIIVDWVRNLDNERIEDDSKNCA